jgi:hypothetical protein
MLGEKFNKTNKSTEIKVDGDCTESSVEILSHMPSMMVEIIAVSEKGTAIMFGVPVTDIKELTTLKLVKKPVVIGISAIVKGDLRIPISSLNEFFEEVQNCLLRNEWSKAQSDDKLYQLAAEIERQSELDGE